MNQRPVYAGLFQWTVILYKRKDYDRIHKGRNAFYINEEKIYENERKMDPA
jgi:hypothetical protein